MKLSPRFAALALTALLAVAVTGCAKKPAATTPVPSAPTTTQTPAPTPTPTPTPPAPEPVKPAVSASDLQTVYFEYDSFTLSDNARAALDANAKLLRENASLEVSLDGHCDERGTAEYNQALGQKRAEAVVKSLALLGAGEGQIEAVSFGKERPVADGHDEAAWARNRRAELKDR